MNDVVEGGILEATCESEFANALMTINTKRTMGESLKWLHEEQDKLFSAESAKKAKLVQVNDENAALSVLAHISVLRKQNN